MALTKQERRTAAQALKGNPLLAEILKARERVLIDAWRRTSDVSEQCDAWTALRQLDLLAGAIQDNINDAIRDDTEH